MKHARTLSIIVLAALMFCLGMLANNVINDRQAKTEIRATEIKPSDKPDNGKITGSFTYPSEVIPTDVVACAEDITTGKEVVCSKEQIKDENLFIYGVGYEISLPAGKYHVYAKAAGSGKAYFNGYMSELAETEEWPDYNKDKCQKEYLPTEITVSNGKTINDIVVGDWYFEASCLAS